MINGRMVPLDICPVAPGNAQVYVDELTGYVLWGVGIMFVVALIVAVGAIVAGRLFNMTHASRVGVISIVVVFISAIAYLVLPGMLQAILDSGCINTTGGGRSAPSGSAP